MWKQISSQKEIDDLMEKLNFFHDSCIKELRYVGGGHVKDNLQMYPTNDKREVYVYFQQQCLDHAAIELCFERVQHLNLIPISEEYDCIIFEASFLKVENKFYWAEFADLDISNLEKKHGTWIVAESVRYRGVEGGLGKGEKYRTVVNADERNLHF